jgi:UDP-glucose 4-epimerase
MVIPTFVGQALAGEPITVFGDGTQSRAFTYVGDVVTGLLGLAMAPEVTGQVFNIGNSEEISMLALAAKIKAMTGSSSEIVRIPYDVAYEAGFEDMPRRVPDLRKIHAAVGYTPTVGLDDILERVIAHERAHAAVRR